MGWKGTMRSLAAASRAAARDAEKRHKASLKQQQLDNAVDAVEAWKDYIDNLISVHVDLADAIDWEKLSKLPRPMPPNLGTKHKSHAEKQLAEFKPKFFDFLRGGSDKREHELELNIQRGIDKDVKEFEKLNKKYQLKLEEWQLDTSTAKKLLSGDTEAFKEVLTELRSLVDEDRIGDHINFQILDDKVHALPSVHTDEIIPKFRRKLRASGTLSQTNMPKGQFNELYQDYVASVALKVAGDLFHVLPVDMVHVTCVTSMLNSKTGHKEDTPILSVQFVRDTFKTLNLKNIDPSDSIQNFNHNMKFTKTKGFSKIEPLIQT